MAILNLLKSFSNIAESIAYEFGPGRGIITYTFPTDSVADTETDKVALGFVTSKADAVLLRIESSNTQDYMQMEIVSSFTNSLRILGLRNQTTIYKILKNNGIR